MYKQYTNGTLFIIIFNFNDLLFHSNLTLEYSNNNNNNKICVFSIIKFQYKDTISISHFIFTTHSRKAIQVGSKLKKIENSRLRLLYSASNLIMQCNISVLTLN